MKTTLLLAISLIVFSSSYTFAQNKSTQNLPRLRNAGGEVAANNDNGVPVVLLGTIETTNTSRERVLSYPRLQPQRLGCEVTSFNFTITANGKTWGPVTVKGPLLSEKVKNKIKVLDPSDVQILIDQIHVRCGGQDMIASPIHLSYHY